MAAPASVNFVGTQRSPLFHTLLLWYHAPTPVLSPKRQPYCTTFFLFDSIPYAIDASRIGYSLRLSNIIDASRVGYSLGLSNVIDASRIDYSLRLSCPTPGSRFHRYYGSAKAAYNFAVRF